MVVVVRGKGALPRLSKLVPAFQVNGPSCGRRLRIAEGFNLKLDSDSAMSTFRRLLHPHCAAASLSFVHPRK